MKKWYFLILSFGFAVSTVFQVSAKALPETVTWEQLKKSSSTSVVTAAGNCQKWINEARSNCKASIDQATQVIAQKKDNAAVQTLIVQETTEEVSSILQSVASNVYGQLSEVGSRFQKRLEQVVNTNDSIKPEIRNELKGMLQSPTNQSDQNLADIQQLLGPLYNPSKKLKEVSVNELGKMAEVSNLEIDRMQKVILLTLNQLNEGITIAKDLQTVLKKSGQLPQNWTTSDNLKGILLTSTHISSTLQSIGKATNQSNSQTLNEDKKPQEKKNKVMSMRQTIKDELSLIEDEVELDDEEDNESGCGQIFERSKKRIRTKLVASVKDIKKATDAKSIDSCTSNVLETYGELLGDVCHKINGKIVDFSHQFIKLYKSVSDIMESINVDMNKKMVEIFNDQSTDTTDFYYNNIRKYFAETYLTEAKMHDLHDMIGNCMKTSKTRKTLQKQIIKQLSTVTSDLVRDMDTMKSTTVYILLEIRKGVSALQNLKNKSNVSGIRYWFNFYDGKTDLAQVKKIINIINAININGIFEREILTLQSSVNLSKCENLTEIIQDTLSKRTSDLLSELDQKTNLNEVELMRSQFLQTFNSVLTIYKLKVKKVMKQTVVTFINVYEETLITLKRKNVKDVHFLDAILDNETRNIDSDIPIFAIYLAKDTEMSVEQDTGITLRRKFKNLGEAKYTLKSNINEINQIVSTHMTEMKTGIQQIMITIAEETKNLQQLQNDIENNKDYIIDVNKFIKLEYLMKLANTLQISHGDIANGLSTDSNSSNPQLGSYLDNAIERLRSEKQNAIIEIEKCSSAKQLQVQVTTVTTRLTEIISDTVMEIRSDISRYTTQYKTALNTYIKCTNHETLFKVLERGRNDNKINIALSEHLRNYLQDQYSQSILGSFGSFADKNKNIQKSKALLVESLSITIKQIENDIGSAKSEAMNTIFSTFKQAIDLLEMVNLSETKQRLDEEKIQKLIYLSRLLKILQEDTAVDVEGSITQARNAIKTGREAVAKEYKSSIKTLSSNTNTNTIQAEIINAVNLFESIYNIMRQQVKSRMETLSLDHYEKFKIVNTHMSRTQKIMQEIMSGTYNKEFIEREEYQKISSFINSDSYTSSLAISSIYEKLSNGQSNKITNGQCLNVLNNLNMQIESNLDKMEEMVNYVANIYGESTNIIVSINEGKALDITDVNDISILTQSLLIYQTLLQVQNKADFAGVQKTIYQEYREAMQTILSTQDENTVQETIIRSIEKYDTVTNILENEVTQKFMKITADFTNKYETVMQVVIAKNNEELLAILQNILEKKVCDSLSEKYKKFESYINSCSFRSTTFAKDSYQTIIGQQENSSVSKDIRLEQLKILTDKVEEYIQELDIESEFASEHILKGANILDSIQGGNFELTQEHIQTITECVMISQMVFKQNFSNVGVSRNNDELEAISTAKRSVEEEYKYAMETLKTTKEKVIIEQTIATSIYKYDDIYNNLREEMKQTFSTLQIEFMNTYDTITEILLLQNIPMYDRLQKIKGSPTNLSTKYTKFESYIKSETFTSYSLIRHELLKLKQAMTDSKIDTFTEQMDTLTKRTNKQIEEISKIQRFVTEVLQRSTEILQNTETDINIQLNEEQFSILCEAFKISKIIEAVISSKEQIDEKFLMAERSINDVYESAINEMQAISFNENILFNSITNFTTIYNNLRINVQEMFTHKSTFFVSTFTSVSKSTLLQNSKLSLIFEDVKKKKTDAQQFSEEYQDLVTYINSDKFSSSSYVSYMYQIIRMQELSSTTNSQERSVQQLSKLTDDVRQITTKLNQIYQLVLDHFNENIECLKAIENGSTSKLTPKQIIRLTECVNISEILTFTCVTVTEEKEIIFQTAETTINKEFEKTISFILQTTETTEIMQIMDTLVHHYDETYNYLKKEIKETLMQTSTEYSKYYTQLLENIKSMGMTELQTFLEELKNTRKLTSFIESYKKCEIYLNSDSFKSSSWVLQQFNKKPQPIEITTEGCTKELQTITSEINYQITQARYASNYIVHLFQQNTEIFKLLESSFADQQLTQEQKYSLTESMNILDQISCKFSNKSQQEETLYIETQTKIRSTHTTAINTIRNTKEVHVMKQTLLESAKNYNDYYNSYRKEVKSIFTQITTEYSETFEIVIRQVTNQNSNSELQTTLYNIKNKIMNTQVSEKFTKFKLYINAEKFLSTNIIKRLYSKMDTQVESNNINNRSLYQIQSLTNETDILVNELNDIRQYISETIQLGVTILRTIENNCNINISQEQIRILNESILVSEIISIECSSISQEEEQIFITAENSIEEKQNNAINTITSSDDVKVVEGVIKTTIKNYDEIYNSAREEVKKSFTTSTTEFSQLYTKITETFETERRTKIMNLLQDIQKKKMNTEISQRYKNFETYISSEAFITVLLATHSYQNITKHSNTKDYLRKESIGDVGKIAEEIQSQLIEMNSVQKYISQTLQKSIRILKTLEKDSNITEMTQEEIKILTESIMITETVHILFNSTVIEKEEIFTLAERKIDQEHENALNKIKATTDEETIMQTMQESIETYDTTVKSIQEEVKNTFTETTTQFMSTFTEILDTTSHTSKAVKTVLQDIRDHKVEVEVSKEFILCEEFLSSETYSTFSTTEFYNEIQKEEITERERTVNDRCINQLEKVTTKVNKYITQTHIVRKYITQIFEKSTKILKIVEQEENIELTREQTNILNESIMVSEKLSSQSNEVVDTKKKITKECENAVQSINTANTKEEVEEIIENNIQTYTKMHRNVEEKMEMILTQTSIEFKTSFDTLLQTSKDSNSQILREIEYSKDKVKNDQKLSKFKSYIENKQIYSINTINKTYTNILESEKNQGNFKVQGIQKLKNLSQEVNNDLIEMDEYQKYATENIAKGGEILQTISDTKNVNLDEEQIITIAKTVEIIEIINQNIIVKKEKNIIEESKIDKMDKNKLSKNIENQDVLENTKRNKTVGKTQPIDSIDNGKKENIGLKATEQQKSDDIKTFDIQMVQNSMLEEHEATINLIRETENEKVQEVVQEHKKVLDETYNDAQQKTRTQIAQISDDHSSHLQKTMSDVKNAKVGEILNKIINEDTTYAIEEDKELVNFISCVKNKNFLADTIEENIDQETLSTLDIKERSIQEVDNIDKKVNDSLKNMDETSKFVSENFNRSNAILEKIRTGNEVVPNEEEMKQIVRSTKINKVLQESEALNLNNVPNDKAVDTSDNLTTTNEKTYKVNKFSKTEEKKITQQSVDIENQNFAIYQSSIGEETEKGSGESKIEHEITETEKQEVDSATMEKVDINDEDNKLKEQKEKGIGCMQGGDTKTMITAKNNLQIPNRKENKIEKLATVANKVSKDIQKLGETENTELEVKQNTTINNEDVTEKANVLNSSVKSQTQNTQFEISEKRQCTQRIKNDTDTILEQETGKFKPTARQEVQNSEDEKGHQSTLRNEDHTMDIAAIQHTIKEENSAVIDTTKHIKNEHQFSETENTQFEVEKNTTINNKEIIKKGNEFNSPVKSQTQNTQFDTLANEDHTIDFTAIQHTVEEENSAIIDTIKQTKNEEQVEEMVKEHIQVLEKTYENARHTAEDEITHTSDEFVNTFQSTLSQVQNTDTQNTLNRIMNDDLNDLVQEDEELQKFECHIKSETFSSTYTVKNEFQSIQESETTTDVKEKSIHEIEAIGTKVNENLRNMEETTKFVSENLQKSADILKKVDTDTEIKLNEEEVNQIAKSMKITKVLYESETFNSDSQTTMTRSVNTPSNSNEIGTKNSKKIENLHTNTEIREDTHEQSTLATTKMGSKSAFNDLMKDNCLSVEPQKCHENKSKVLEKVSTSNLLVNWEVNKSEDKCWPTECRNLSWNSNTFSNSMENKIFIEEINQILKISRNLIENTINIELKKLKLNRKVREDLSAMTVCVDNIYNIMQRLSTYVFEEMERFTGTVGSQIKTANIEEKLKTVSTTLDDEFMAVGRTFFDLQYSKSSDMLDLIDQQYENEICDTISKSRKVAMKKLEKLQSTTNTILDNIDCLVLTMLDTFVSAELTIQDLAKGSKNVSLESLKNCQKLYEILET